MEHMRGITLSDSTRYVYIYAPYQLEGYCGLFNIIKLIGYKANRAYRTKEFKDSLKRAELMKEYML